MIQPHAIERVEEGEPALDLVRLDHGLEDLVDRDGLAFPREVVRDGEDCSEVVGGVAPCSITSEGEGQVEFDDEEGAVVGKVQEITYSE